MSRARLPLVVLNMARGQGDYFQSTRGGGHGDYSRIVLAPADVREDVGLVQRAFDLADEWRTPVLVLGDYYLAHTQQSVTIPGLDQSTIPEKPWAVDGTTGGTGSARFVSPLTPNKRNDADFVNHGTWLEAFSDLVDATEAGVEPVVDTFAIDDAELVLVAYGTPARYLRAVVEQLREDGIRVGLVRPVTLWPFPTEAVASAARGARGVAVFELNRGQMITDVRLALMDACPVAFIGGPSFDRSGFGIAPALDVESLALTVRNAYDAVTVHAGGLGS